ncbi:MAG: integrase core domain-containing protein [Candidatus Thermoplasmatota archaeon]|jgi:putative transposase|nr:integrase core domain-containing protein [Candidatus Thermoplasmatota archaeon]
MMNIDHERIHFQTPKKDAYIGSFNSILERDVISRFELKGFTDAEAMINRFVEFYDNERVHSEIGYGTLGETYRKNKVKCTENA